MMETRTVFFQRSSTTNISRFKDEINPADHWVAKELRRHRWQSVCRYNEPFTLGGNYVLSISDKDLIGSEQKKSFSWLMDTLRYDELLTYGPTVNSSNQ